MSRSRSGGTCPRASGFLSLIGMQLAEFIVRVRSYKRQTAIALVVRFVPAPFFGTLGALVESLLELVEVQLVGETSRSMFRSLGLRPTLQVERSSHAAEPIAAVCRAARCAADPSAGLQCLHCRGPALPARRLSSTVRPSKD